MSTSPSPPMSFVSVRGRSISPHTSRSPTVASSPPHSPDTSTVTPTSTSSCSSEMRRPSFTISDILSRRDPIKQHSERQLTSSGHQLLDAAALTRSVYRSFSVKNFTFTMVRYSDFNQNDPGSIPCAVMFLLLSKSIMAVP